MKTIWPTNWSRLAPVFVFAGLLAGCATAPPSAEALAANDPYEITNRDILKLNGKIDRNLIGPIVGGYFFLVPEGGRKVIHNFVVNLSLPTVFANDLLQGEGERAGQTLARLTINSTLGVGGLFDPATNHFHVPADDEDFGQTLAVWGVGEGPYLVQPFVGPQPPRDAFGVIVDAYMDPLLYMHIKRHIWWATARYAVTLLDLRAQSYSTLQGIQRSSLDYYVSLRSIYRQNRNTDIRNGRPNLQSLPEF
jgi:phospholipid-binding lipoprotein MlaA